MLRFALSRCPVSSTVTAAQVRAAFEMTGRDVNETAAVGLLGLAPYRLATARALLIALSRSTP